VSTCLASLVLVTGLFWSRTFEAPSRSLVLFMLGAFDTSFATADWDPDGPGL
jgi:hypothetical protein